VEVMEYLDTNELSDIDTADITIVDVQAPRF
jgi:hypothetical protein